MRPLLLMDVDGPLNPVWRRLVPWAAQRSYVIHELTPAGERTYQWPPPGPRGGCADGGIDAYDLV